MHRLPNFVCKDANLKERGWNDNYEFGAGNVRCFYWCLMTSYTNSLLGFFLLGSILTRWPINSL
jgi:hypothetical protein